MERRDFFRKLGFAAGAIMIAPALLKTEESEGYVIEGDKISEGGREYYHKEVRLIELNVIGESTRAGEVHDILKDAEYLQDFVNYIFVT